MNLRLIKTTFALSLIFSSKQMLSMEAAAQWFTIQYPTAIIISPQGVTLNADHYPGVTGLFKALKILKEIIKNLDVGEPDFTQETASQSALSTISLTPSSSISSNATSCQCSQNIFDQCSYCAP